MAKVLFSSQGIIETPTLLLQRKNFETIGNGGITNVSGLTYKNNFNDANEISFKIHKFNNGIKHPLWDSMVDFKIIYIPQLHERFEISVTTSEEDPNDVSKPITGTSLCEAELSQITLRNVQINTEADMINPLYDENFPTILYRDPEEYDSVENLAIWAKSKYNYLKDKTAYPTEESVIARKKSILKHASLLHRVLEKAPHYSISYVADTLKKLKTVHEFTLDGTDILSALKHTIADDFHCLFMFNSENRTISVLDLYSTCGDCGYRGDYMDECPECGSNNITNKYGEDTNILINSTNLTTQITLDSNSDSLKNCFYITGADDVINAAIANVNPNGTQYIYYFSNETLADMPTELQNKLKSYNTLYDEINTTREYNLKTDRVAEYNKVINYINTKFASMSKDDQDKIEYPTLISPLVGYPAVTSAWYSAMDVYYFLNDSMMPVIDVDGMGLDDSIIAIQDGLKDLGGVAVTGIKTITQSAVKGSVDALVKTFFSASYYDMDITDSSLSNYDSSTHKRKWSGTITLTSHSQMDENNQYLTKSVKITTDVIESTEKYIEQKITRMTNRADDIKDKQITSIKLAEDKFKEQLGYYSLTELNNLKKEFEACRDIAVDGFTDESVDVQYNNSELKDKYVNFYSGRIIDIQNEIKTRESQIEAVNAIYNTEKSTGEIQDIVNSVKAELDLENYLGEELYMLWYSYRREDDYSNDNYSSTGLDDVTLIKRATELVEAAKKELYKAGNLQYSLSATMGNLLALDEFKPIKNKFEVGNFIKVGIDDKVYSLRLMSYETNFDSIQDMSVEFSTVEKVYTGYSDVQSVLDASRSMATSYSSVKDQVDKSKKATDTVNDWSDNGINGDNTQFANSSEQTILINKNGILGRSYDDQLDEFSLKQFKLVNNGMYFTKDGWQSIETGIGRFTYRDINGNLVEDYGIIAKTVVGNLIIGKELQIYNEDKSIVMDENGLTINGGYLKITGTEIGEDGTSIAEVIIDLNTAKQLAELAKKTAEDANTTANNAKDTADDAKSTADTANETANTAKNTADTAQNTANEAHDVADTAKNTADGASKVANEAKSATEDLKTETNEIRELAEKGVDHVTAYFYQSDSATELVGGEWTTNSVTWISGKYVWQKVITYYKDGTDNSQTAKAICISGANGQDGKPGENGVKGKGVKSITPQYAISDSNVLQPNGGWSDKEPAWSEGKYIWTRTLVIYDDNTQETTTPIVSNGLNSALSISTAARKQADSAKSTADSANTTASEAKSTADSASQTANKASENATSAVDKANTANTNASSALTTATLANKTANDASSKADNATKTANSASEKADSANANASIALTTSNSAKTTADNASKAANKASTDASTALDTANTANSNASMALDTANEANKTANSASTKADNATKTANSASEKATSASNDASTAIETSNAAKTVSESAKSIADTAKSLADSVSDELATNYSTTQQVEKKIDDKADSITSSITTTISTTYETKADSSQKFTDAKSYADGIGSDTLTSANKNAKSYADTAESNANKNTATQLTSYSTTEQMNSAISQESNKITTSVSEKYATKATVADNLETAKSYADGVGSNTLSSANTTAKGYANNAESNAKTYTTNQLKSYSTTKDVESKIEQSANAIKQTVSETYVTNTTYATDIKTIQGQIDGNIQTWSGKDVPTLKNEPASTWSDDEKATHVGDIYYDGNNHAYRFRVDDGVYSWQILTDTDVTKALSDAADAMDKATSTETKLLTDYKTASDTTSEINQTKNGILQTVKDTYAESATVTNLSNNLKTNYSTTKDMQSAIDEKADSITLAVSEKYQTIAKSEEDLNTAKSYADGVGSSTLASAKADATAKADAAEKNAIDNTTETLKSYSNTEEMNSAIQAKADSINLSVSEKYETKVTVAENLKTAKSYADGVGSTTLEAAKSDATSKANAAQKNVIADTTEKLKSYSTIKDMNSAISEKADAITLAVSETYSTKKTVEENLATSKSYADGIGSKTLESAKTDATTKANQAKSDAIADTDKKLTSYSTTEQMNSAIKTSADNITSTVSKTYSTKEEVANIQVGGRNLLVKTNQGKTKWCNAHANADGSYSCESVNWNGINAVKMSCTTPTTSWKMFIFDGLLENFDKLEAGGNYILSYDVIGNIKVGFSNLWDGSAVNSIVEKSSITILETAYGYHYTVDILLKSTLIKSKQVVYFRNDLKADESVIIANLKLEKGNKATDWTPAPEDVSSDISTSKADAISSANANTDEKLKSYETITNVDSKISQSATDITSTVKKTYETIDNVNKVRTSVTEAETKAQQSLDQFLWLVKSGSSSTSLTLTDSAVTAITKQFIIKSPDGSATIIEGGKLKTDALKSNNYVAGNDGTYSSFGTFLDLSDGSIHTPGFYLDNAGNAFYQGTVNADAGYFGDANNNWYIGSAEFDNIRNKDDALVSGVEYSALISKGNAALTAGHWYLMSQDGSLGIQSGWTTINGGNYVFDKATQKYYDMGMVEPIFGSKNEWDNKFLYIRRVKDPSSSQATWEYLFKVDKDGTIYENGTKLSDKYARKDAVGSTYLPLTGGTVTGNLTVNGTLTATASKANQLTHTLSVNGKSWNGSADLTVGTIGVAYGGTGKSSWTANGIVYASASGTLSQLSLGTAGYILQSGGTSAPVWVNPSTLNVASATKATKDGNGNVISNTYLRKDFDSVSQNVSFDGSVDIDDLTAGTLLVSGVARFANGLIGNLKGTASNVPWSGITDKPSTFTPSAHTHTMSNISDWGTYVYNAQGTRTKNTVLAAPNGSDGKATFRSLVEADIPTLSKSKVGLGNVDNTADSAKNVLSASKLTTARNINGVAFDGSNNITITANPTATQLTGENLNDITTPGEYFAAGSNAVTNKPSGVDAFSLQVLKSAAGWYEQLIISSNLWSGKIYQRRWMGTAWSSWTSVYSELFKPSKSDVGLGNVDNTADSVKNVSSATKLTTARNITVGSAKKSFDGTADISFSLADIGASASGHTHNYASKLTLAGTDYSCVSNVITITKANLQTAIGSTGLGLMTAEERTKLNSIKVSSGGTIDFSGVTASGALTATVGSDKTVALTHNTSGVKAGTYKSVIVDTYGHVTAGTNPTTLSGYGITDALSSSTKYALSGSVGGNALRANLLANLGRLTDANVAVTGSGGVATFKATSSMTSHKPPKEGHILHFYWDGKNNWDSQMCISADSSPTVYVRGMTGQANTYGDWKTLLDSTNYTSYTVKKDGTGASGTWGIDITGSATSATNDSNGKKISDTYLPLSGGTLTGALNILGGDRTSYSEGIRMHVSSLGWTAMVLCGSDNTGNTGTSAKTWGIYNHDGLFYITKSGSTSGTAQLSCIDDNVWRVNGNILLHAGNYNSYAPKKDGTGASGTWDISITGNAKTATSADSATKAAQDGNGNVISSTYLPLSGGIITGDLKVDGYLLGESSSSGYTNHALLLGHTGQNYMNFYEFGGLFQFYQSQSGLNALLGKITSNGWEGNVVGNVTGNLFGNASSATKATQDGAGNVITSKYVTIDTAQIISGEKTFSKETTISSTTASTNKATGALKVKGGIASEGQISADKVMIGDAVTLEYNAELQCLNFVFA